MSALFVPAFNSQFHGSPEPVSVSIIVIIIKCEISYSWFRMRFYERNKQVHCLFELQMHRASRFHIFIGFTERAITATLCRAKIVNMIKYIEEFHKLVWRSHSKNQNSFLSHGTSDKHVSAKLSGSSLRLTLWFIVSCSKQKYM